MEIVCREEAGEVVEEDEEAEGEISPALIQPCCAGAIKACYYPKHNYSPFNTEQIMRSVFHLTRYGRGGGGGGGHQSIGKPAPSPPGWLAVARQLTPEVLR